jgi:exopolyphosphatase/guanosine-5'-triphosphate,3'-diphosphate pyrophosphatase
MKVEDRLHLPGVSEARAPQLLAGALVAEAALELFEFPSLEICPWALREGLILRRLDQLVFAGPLDPAPHIGQPADEPPSYQSSSYQSSAHQPPSGETPSDQPPSGETPLTAAAGRQAG